MRNDATSWSLSVGNGPFLMRGKGASLVSVLLLTASVLHQKGYYMDAKDAIEYVLHQAMLQGEHFTVGNMQSYLWKHYQINIDRKTCLKHMDAILAEYVGHQTGADTPIEGLPEQVIVQPHLIALGDDQGRDFCNGRTIKGSARGSSLYSSERQAEIRAWLAERGYTHVRNLANGYMAERGLDGIYRREGE
jgi:hypothetical protein